MSDGVTTMVPSAAHPAVVESPLTTLGVLARLVRDPLTSIPPEAYAAPLVRARFAGGQRLYLVDPALIQDALVRHADDLAKTADVGRVLGPALGQGLLTAEGPIGAGSGAAPRPPSRRRGSAPSCPPWSPPRKARAAAGRRSATARRSTSATRPR